MKVLIDTSAYSNLSRGDREIGDVLASASRILVPTIVLGELRSGFRRGRKLDQNIKELETFLAEPQVEVAPVTEETAIWYAEIDVYLIENGHPIPRNDVWIAALARQHGCILLTRDSHFRQIPLLPLCP